MPGISVSHYIHSKSPLFGKSIKEKYFEPMDILEVALRSEFDDDFIFFLVEQIQKHSQITSQLVKLLVFYERAPIIEKALSKVKSKPKEVLVLDIFEYAFSIDRFKVLFYFVKKYNIYLFKNSSRVIESLN